MTGTWYALPDETMDDPWFTPERLWRTAWIGRFALRSNNCVALTAQLSKPLSILAKEWKCTIKVVRNTLEGLAKKGMIRVTFGKVKGKLQTVITCLFSRFYDESKFEKGTERASDGHGDGHIYRDRDSKKEDSPVSPQGDPHVHDGSFPGMEEQAGAGLEQPVGAGPSEVPPEPQQPADHHPNSAAPSSRKPRAKREKKPALVPHLGWEPREDTIVLLMDERKISRWQVLWQAKLWIDWCQAHDAARVNFDADLRKWIRGPYYKPVPEPGQEKPAARNFAREKYEEAFPI